MFCNKCGKEITDCNSNFCSKCGNKLQNNGYIVTGNKSLNDDSTNFLIAGIILSLCCCLPIGIAVILINELKYKKLIADGLGDEAKKIRTIMIVLIIIGVVLFVLIAILNVLSFIIEIGLNTTSNYV